MKIGFDAKRAFQNRTGLGNYSRYVIDILCRHYPEHTYMAFAPHCTDEPRMQALLDSYPQLSASFPAHSFNKAYWRLRGICHDIRQKGVDVFFGLSGELPLGIEEICPSVVTVHDLIFLRFPQYYPFIDRKIYAWKMRRACLSATRIVAISECTKRDIQHFFGIPADKISVIYQGCDPAFQSEDTEERDEEVARHYNLPQRFILSVGSIEERKNAGLLVKTLEHLPQDVHLVLVGKRTPYTQTIELLPEGLKSRLHILQGVPFTHLPSVYRLCTVFAYPSRYEGFGIPILEALRSGVPVLAATGSCLEEAGGEGALYIDPDDVSATVQTLHRLLDDQTLRTSLITAGKQHAARFDAATQARQLMQVLKP